MENIYGFCSLCFVSYTQILSFYESFMYPVVSDTDSVTSVHLHFPTYTLENVSLKVFLEYLLINLILPLYIME